MKVIITFDVDPCQFRIPLTKKMAIEFVQDVLSGQDLIHSEEVTVTCEDLVKTFHVDEDGQLV